MTSLSCCPSLSLRVGQHQTICRNVPSYVKAHGAVPYHSLDGTRRESRPFNGKQKRSSVGRLVSPGSSKSEENAFTAAGTAALIGQDPRAASDAARGAAKSKTATNDNQLDASQAAGSVADDSNTLVDAAPSDPTIPSSSDLDQPLPKAIGPVLLDIYARCQTWQWRGNAVNYFEQGDGPAVLLVHGFGASIGHWRSTIPCLVGSGFRVLAIDLVGLGGSDKPVGFPYSIEAWSEMLSDFMSEVVAAPTVLVGNSIGSLVALSAAAASPSSLVSGVVLVNCAGGLNNKAIQDDWRIRLALPIFWLIDVLLGIPAVAKAIFNRVRTRDNVRTVLKSVYCNKKAVDEELVELILRPSRDPGALEAFVAVLTGPPGPRPETLIPVLAERRTPVLLLWGDKDTFTPADGPVGKYFRSLPDNLPIVRFVELPDVGHCPHDDRPELVHNALLPWLEGVTGKQ